jgi:hypothetical protein
LTVVATGASPLFVVAGFARLIGGAERTTEEKLVEAAERLKATKRLRTRTHPASGRLQVIDNEHSSHDFHKSRARMERRLYGPRLSRGRSRHQSSARLKLSYPVLVTAHAAAEDSRGRRRDSHRKHDAYRCALIHGRLDLDLSAMGVHHPANDRQAQASPSGFARAEDGTERSPADFFAHADPGV